MKSPPPLILASTSRYRRELLARLQIPFECRSPGVDETHAPGETAPALTARLARRKADAVAALEPDAWVIGSDQVAAWDAPGQPQVILGKPGTAARCIGQLEACSARTLAFVTAVVVLRHRDGASFHHLDTTRVTFRPLERSDIERYVAREAPLDCAGGFKSEGLGIALCESITSEDPTALIGLPLVGLSRLLRHAGYPLP